jgi:YVTN family beta-propeller protein
MANSPTLVSIGIAATAALALGATGVVAQAAPISPAAVPVVSQAAAPPVAATLAPGSELAVISTVNIPGDTVLAVGAGPDAGDAIYAVEGGNPFVDGVLSRINPSTFTVDDTISVGRYPIGIAVSSDDTVYVVNANSNNMTVVSGGETMTFFSTVAMPTGRNEPQAVALSRVTDDTVFVTTKSGGAGPTVQEYNADTLARTSENYLPNTPNKRGLTISRADVPYISSYDGNAVYRLVTSFVTVTRPSGVAISDDDTVYVASQTLNSVWAYPADDSTAINTVAVGNGPQGLTIGLDGTVYVANRNSATVSAINPSTFSQDDTVTVGSDPTSIARTGSGLIVVANEGSDSLSVLAPVSAGLTTSRASAGDTASLTIGGLPAGVLVDDTTVEAISFGDDTVSWSRTAGTNTFTWVVPSGSGTVNVAVSLNGGNRASAGAFTYAVPPPPAPPTPASPPSDVVASAGDASASVSWAAPASSGSFPVSNYLVTSSPDGRICLTSALSCTVTGLSNGTPYTFTVKALTGAGWSAASAPSNAVTPEAAPKPSITITGSREGKRIDVAGATTGFGMGGELKPWIRPAGRTLFTQGVATILVSMDGTFEWGRRSGKQVSVYVATPDGSLRSNTVTIRGR